MCIKRLIAFIAFIFFAIISNTILLAEDLPTPDMMKCPYNRINTNALSQIEKQKNLYHFYFCQIKEFENELNTKKDNNTEELIRAQIEVNNKHLKRIIEEIKYHQ